LSNHDYVPRRNWDTGEAPYTIRQSGHLSGCATCGGSPLAHAGPGGWPWYAIIGTTLTLVAIGTAVLHFLH
jgi:hypothetical protein